MLARRWDKIDKSKVKFPVYIEIKFDGIRILVFRKKDHQRVLTRYAHTVPVEYAPSLKEGVYDGEIWKPGMEFNKMSGQIRAGNLEGAVIEIFDYLTWDEWNEHRSPIQKVRRERLEKMQFKLPFRLVKSYLVDNEKEVERYYRWAIEHGFEGIMIKESEAEYRWDRKGGWYKYKKVHYEDAQIIGFEEGTGRVAGALGALIVKLKDSRITKVGTGFSDELRKHIWKRKDYYKGQWIEIKFQEKGPKAVRMPVFVRFKV